MQNDCQPGNVVVMTVTIGLGPTYYYLKDHLGSVRATIDEKGNRVGYDDYYPFGEIMPGRSSNSAIADAKYKFTGKERDVETSLDYFGARYYDSWRGQWLSVDPRADKYPGWSPYMYSADNPIGFLDPDGREVYGVNFAYFKGAPEGVGLAPGFSASYVWDDHGAAALMITGYGGVGAGALGGAAGYFKYDKMTSIDQLQGVDSNLSAGLATGFLTVNVDFSMALSWPIEFPTFAASAAPTGQLGAVAFGGGSGSKLFLEDQLTKLRAKWGTDMRVELEGGKLIVLDKNGKEITDFDFNPSDFIQEMIGVGNQDRKQDSNLDKTSSAQSDATKTNNNYNPGWSNYDPEYH